MTSTNVSAWSPPQRRTQIAGAVLIVAVCAFWALLVPLVNRQVDGTNPFKPGVAYDLGGATIVPADGWEHEGGADALFTTLKKGTAAAILTPPVEAAGTIEEKLQVSIDGLNADASVQWQIGDVGPFTTDSGVPGGRVVGISADQAVVTYIIDDGATSLTVVVTSDPASWRSLGAEIDTMMRSIVLLGVPTSTSSVPA